MLFSVTRGLLADLRGSISQGPLLRLDAFLGVAAIWIVFTMAMLAHQRAATTEGDDVWRKIISVNPVLSGPTAYYLGRFRPQVTTESSSLAGVRRSRMCLDTLAAMAFLGAFVLIVGTVALLTLPASSRPFEWLGAGVLVAVVVVALSGFALSVLFLIDAAERPAAAWARADYLRLLNPWSWVFGLGAYYLRVLRPEIGARDPRA